jgi:predicted CoA-binding protein
MPAGLIDTILDSVKTVAVVGISNRPERPSHHVAAHVKQSGYTIIPVNPALAEVLGETCYPSLDAIPGPVDLVDVFRRSEDVLPIAEEALRKGARYFWMQEGVINEAAKKLLEDAGVGVVMDRCMLKELAARGR